MPVISLSAAQTVRVHGLFPRSALLRWETVLEKRLPFTYLHHSLGIAPDALHALQPSAAAWVDAGLVSLSDCAAMRAWPLNPLRDLHMSPDALLGMPAAELAAAGVDAEQLFDAGLTPPAMRFFQFSLAQWGTLGLRAERVRGMGDEHTRELFGLSAPDTLAALQSGA